MISLCSGCIHYYLFNCDKPIDQKALVRVCDHFTFTATKTFHNPKKLYKALADLPIISPNTH